MYEAVKGDNISKLANIIKHWTGKDACIGALLQLSIARQAENCVSYLISRQTPNRRDTVAIKLLTRIVLQYGALNPKIPVGDKWAWREEAGYI